MVLLPLMRAMSRDLRQRRADVIDPGRELVRVRFCRSRASQGRFSPGGDEPRRDGRAVPGCAAFPSRGRRTRPRRAAARRTTRRRGTASDPAAQRRGQAGPDGTRSGGRSAGWVVDSGVNWVSGLPSRWSTDCHSRCLRVTRFPSSPRTCPAGMTPGSRPVAAFGEEEQVLVGDPHVARGDLKPELIPQVSGHRTAQARLCWMRRVPRSRPAGAVPRTRRRSRRRAPLCSRSVRVVARGARPFSVRSRNAPTIPCCRSMSPMSTGMSSSVVFPAPFAPARRGTGPGRPRATGSSGSCVPLSG